MPNDINDVKINELVIEGNVPPVPAVDLDGYIKYPMKKPRTPRHIYAALPSVLVTYLRFKSLLINKYYLGHGRCKRGLVKHQCN